MSKCTPCHIDLDAFKNPNIVNFNHPVHFKKGIKCDACHVTWPHQPGGLVKPTMDACANCHQLEHSSQGKAAPSTNCGLCHPPDFKLKPDDHDGADFSAKGHADAGETQIQKCLLCHTGNSCESCHDDNGVPPAPAKNYRRIALWAPPTGKGIKITLDVEPVEMWACQSCHLKLEDWKNDRLVNFNHGAHFKKQIACDRCHKEWPHTKRGTEKPKMEACVSCHRLDHGDQSRLVVAEKGSYSEEYCYLCHPQDMALKPAWHTSEFADGGHKKQAKEDRGFCRGCHTQSFCDDCHKTEIPHSAGWRGVHGSVAAAEAGIGGSLSCLKCHKPEGPKAAYQAASACAKCHKANVYPHALPWKPQHGKAAKEVGRAACATCHKVKVFCDKCHQGVQMPHAENWLGQHYTFLRDNPISICINCHQKEQCEKCHSLHGVHPSHELYDLNSIQ